MQLTPLDSVDHVDWFIDALGEGQTVDGLVPPVYDAYARILHPAAADDGRPVRWAEVAEDQGTTLHPAADFGRLARHRRADPGAGWNGSDPAGGTLDRESLESLVGALAAHTTTPETVWLNLWNGFGQSPAAWSGRPLARQGQGYRDYYGFRCVLDEVVAGSHRFEQIGWEPADDDESTFMVTAEYVGDGDPEDGLPPAHPDERHHDLQSPQQWWPDDRAWSVATEIDVDYTVVGGTTALIEAILAHPDLEAFRMGPYDSLEDSVNSAPSHNR